MLRLREKIGSDHGRGGTGVGEDDQLRRTREHIDRDASSDELLCRGDVAVSGADDHVAWKDGASAERERGDRVGAARRQHAVSAGDGRRGERDRSGLWARDPDLLHARRPRRHRRHQYGRWQRVAAAGRVTTGALQWRDPVPCRTSRQRDGHVTERTPLCLGEHPNPLGDTLQANAIVRRQSRERAIERGPIQEQRSSGGHVGETFGVLAQRGFAPYPYRFYDWRGDSEGLGGHGASATAHQLGDRATAQQAGVFPTIGRRLTAR